MTTASELLVSGIPHMIRKSKRIKSITDKMAAMGVAECIDRRGELIERLHSASSQKAIVEKVGQVSRERVERWVDRGIDAAEKKFGGGKRIDRARFHRRRDLCQQCEHHTKSCEVKGWKDGCGLLEKPCSVELLWMSDKKDWCPVGKDIVAPNRDHFPIVAPPAGWTIDITPTKSTAIVTMAIGKQSEEVAEYTVPQMQRYADRIGAELVVIHDDQFPAFPIGNKFRMSEIGKLYERTLFFDVDVWVSDRTPNLFTLPSGRVWMHKDREHLTRFTWLDQDSALLSETQKVAMESDMGCHNTGVVLFDRSHARMWQVPLHPFAATHTAEQTWVEMRCRAMGVEIAKLPLRYNLQWWMRKRWGKSPAFIHHLAAASHIERLKWLRSQADHLDSLPSRTANRNPLAPT